MHGRVTSPAAGLAIIGASLLLLGSAPALAGDDPDGRYSGELTDEDGARYGEVGFEVARNGRLIKNLETLVLSVCTNPNEIGGIEVIEVPFVFDKVRVKRNGRFAAGDTVVADPPSDAKQYYGLDGRLKNRRVRDAGVVLEGKCESHETFSAKRVGA